MLTCSDEASYHVVSYLIEKLMWQGAEGSYMPTANEKLRFSVLSLISHKELNPANTM